ncbi:histidine kinase [Chryseobacterium ginsengisoli]|uniref:Histidine kinase n=1 Tax=Chryseobacterium ginsengisoli TaxID=363853 RepID=A0ABP9MXC9_9FLAO
MIKKLFFFVLNLFFSLYNSQIPGLLNYNENDGLNSSYTYHLRQDNKGFIWIGSDNGLFKFDGKEFKQYGKKDGLKNIEVISCEPLPNGEVFIIPFMNDFAYLKDGKIANSDINKYLKNQLGTSIPEVQRDGNKLYLFSTNNVKNVFVYENGKIKKIPVSIDYGKDYFGFIKFDPKTKILYQKSFYTKNILAYHIITHKKTYIPCEVGGNVCQKDDFIVLYDKKQCLNIYQLSTPYTIKKIRTYKFKENYFYTFIDKNYKLWVNLENGGTLFFNQSLKEKNQSSKSPVKLLADQVIHNILVDKDDNVWFNSRNNGLFFIAKTFFENYINLPLNNNSEYIKAIEKDGENIILGYNKSSGAIYRNGKFKNIVLDSKSKADNKAVFAKDNTLIFGLSTNYTVYDLISKKQKKLIYSTKNLVPYSNDSVLLCTGIGLFTYNLKSGQNNMIYNDRTYTALPYSKDSLFAGNFSDLYKINTKNKEKKLFLENYYFTDIKKLKDNLYIGSTNLNGIILFNSYKVVRKLTEKNGLINNQIKKLTVENQNVFWASTNSGISRIEASGNNFKINNFTQTDGLPSNMVSGCVIKNDSIFIGTSKGLGIFSIKKLLTQEKFINKKVIINSVKIGNKEYFNLNEKLNGISPDDVVFNLSFLDYTSQGKISYRYKVEGLNNEWQINNSSKIILSSLPPGKYVLKIFGLGYNGKQSYQSTDLAFEIQPQFWQTWWFKLLLALISIGLFIIIINYYFHKKRNKKLETLFYEKKIAELELQAIKAQINPHFIYNCLNSIHFLLYKKDYEETENYLNIFSEMIRKTLHYSEKTFMPISEEIEYLSLYLNMEKLRLKDQFDYKITVSENVNTTWSIPSLLIQPFVENSIKHGIPGLKDRKGLIEISFEYSTPHLCITITDNGIGIDSNKVSLSKANSFGVKLSQKRIETFKQLFEADIILEINNLFEKEGKQGTQIKLYITPYENKNTSMHH